MKKNANVKNKTQLDHTDDVIHHSKKEDSTMGVFNCGEKKVDCNHREVWKRDL